MSRLGDFLKQRKGKLVFISLLLLLLPVCAAWVFDLKWGDVDAWFEGDDDDAAAADSDEYFENLDYQLANVRCPAREGQELKDYWECLWHTSITTEGKRQHEQFLWEDYLDEVDYDLQIMERRVNKMMGRNGTGRNTTRTKRVPRGTAGRKRVRRASVYATPDDFVFEKLNAFLIDTTWPYHWREYDFNFTNPKTGFTGNYRKYYLTGLKKCQQEILPGVNIRVFLNCLRELVRSPEADFDFYKIYTDFVGNSFNPTFQPTTFPPLSKSEYDDEDFPLPEVTDTRSNTRFPLRFDFQPLADEEKMNSFYGADPYFDDSFSPFRYRYDNLNSNQRQPAWSYRGKDGSKSWHSLDTERFYVPMKKSADVSQVEFGGDLVQTYPATGELPANIFPHLQTPLDYRWTKDSGYNAYTRYLLPLLEKNDLDYYKGKGLIDPSVTVQSDAKHLQDMIDDLKYFLNSTILPISFSELNFPYLIPKYPLIWQPNPEEKVELSATYLNLVGHYFGGINMGRYRVIKKRQPLDPDSSNQLEDEMEIGRQLLRSYVQVVITQTACVKEMVDQYEYRIEDEAEIKELMEKAIAANNTCQTANSTEEAVSFEQVARKTIEENEAELEYKVTYANLRKLYDLYFDRKEARQRYSLPKYPVPFPICKHNEPSPIDIRTDRGRKSSLRDYTFGPAAYRMNKFFMFFPLDGSPLLTVGIKDGERLDGSSVQLSGGAVKGQNLTFQYMHIRFSYKWNEVGSEHWVNGKGAPVELQMVFTISGSADPIKYWHVLARVQNQLFQFREKLVVIISVLVDVLPTDEALKEKIEKEDLKQDPYLFEPFAQAAYHFHSIPRKFPNFEEPRGYVSKDPVFRFIEFIPRRASNFYTYRGSLSWPPCFGYVVWSVFEQRLYMSKRQFDQFAKIPAYGIQDDNYAHSNFRRFDDIYVEEEHESHLSYKDIEKMKEARTADRHVLAGYHDVAEDGREKEEDLVVEAIYYAEEERSGGAERTAFGGALGLAVVLIIVQLII